MGIISDRELLVDGQLTSDGKMDFVKGVADRMIAGGELSLKAGPLKFPLVSEGTALSVASDQTGADFFYTQGMTAEAHEEMYPAYHSIFLGVYEKLLGGFDLEAAHVLKPVPLSDPTIVIQQILQFIMEVAADIIAFISDVVAFMLAIVEFIFKRIAEVIALVAAIPIALAQGIQAAIDAIGELIKWVFDLAIELGILNIDVPQVIQSIINKLKEFTDKVRQFILSLFPLPINLFPSLSPLFPDFIPNIIPNGIIDFINSLIPDFPTPPFPLDFQLRLKLPIELGIINFFIEFLTAVIDWLVSALENVVQLAKEILEAIAEGIEGLIRWIVEKILQPIINLLLKIIGFASLMVASIMELVERTIGLILATLVGFLLGDGLILQSVLLTFGFS